MAVGAHVLSDREREVLTLVAQGCRDREIAEQLDLASETIRTHVRNALRKLDARSRAHGVGRALLTREINAEELRVAERARPGRRFERSGRSERLSEVPEVKPTR